MCNILNSESQNGQIKKTLNYEKSHSVYVLSPVLKTLIYIVSNAILTIIHTPTVN